MSKRGDKTLKTSLKRAIRRLVRIVTKPEALINEYVVAPDILGPNIALLLFIVLSVLRSYILFTRLSNITLTYHVLLLELVIYCIEAASLILIPTAFVSILSPEKNYRKFIYISMYILFILAIWRAISSSIIALGPHTKLGKEVFVNRTYYQVLYFGLEKWGKENSLIMIFSRIVGDVIPGVWGIILQSTASARILKARGSSIFMVTAAWIAVEMIFVPVITAALYGLPIKG